MIGLKNKPKAFEEDLTSKKNVVAKNKVLITIVCITMAVLVGVIGTFLYFRHSSINVMSYTDEEQDPLFLACTYNAVEGDNPQTVTLYTYGLNAEKEKISDLVLKDEYLSYGNNERILFMENDALYIKSPASNKEKISDQVIPSSYVFSGDGNSVLYLKPGENELTELYLYTSDGEKEKICSEISSAWTKKHFSISYDGTVVMFKDNENSLYIKKLNMEKEKISSDVDVFTLYSNDAFSYLTYNNSYYVKYSNDIESQKVNNSSIGTLRLSFEGMAAIYLGDFNFEKGCGELYLCTKSNESVKIASSVTRFIVSSDGTLLSYINDEGILYNKKLPKINESTLKQSSKLHDQIVNGEKEKIASDIEDFQTSPSSKFLMYLDSENNLFYKDNDGKTKVASDVRFFTAFENSYIYLSNDNILYRNNNLNDINNYKKNTKKLSDNVSNVSTSKYGEYVAYSNSETDELFATFRTNEPVQITLDCKEYNQIKYYGSSVYERTLKFKDIIGNYENSDLNELYTIDNEHIFTLYRNGAEAENSKISIKAISEHSVFIDFQKQDTEMSKSEYIIQKSQEGAFSIKINGSEYSLKVVESDISTTLENHKKIAEERRKEEERLERVSHANEVGQNYYTNGISLSGNYIEYSRASYSSALSGTWPLYGHHYVYDYEVTSDGKSIWLEIYDQGYYWILVTV